MKQHTQQKQVKDDNTPTLLGKCLKEGACDFMAELLLGRTITSPYLEYGRANEQALFLNFKKEMSGRSDSLWLYNGNHAPGGHADLGYFMGYTICKYYYDHSREKQKALAEIIALNFDDYEAIRLFYEKTGYPGKKK